MQPQFLREMQELLAWLMGRRPGGRASGPTGAGAELSCTAALLADPAQRAGERVLPRILAAVALCPQWVIRFTQGQRRGGSATSSALKQRTGHR